MILTQVASYKLFRRGEALRLQDLAISQSYSTAIALRPYWVIGNSFEF